MFGIGKQHAHSLSSMTYLFIAMLLVNQYLSVHSWRLLADGQDQNELENIQQEAYGRLDFKRLAVPEDLTFDDNEISVIAKPTVQRRFCCMSPVGGRKRFVRSLVRRKDAIAAQPSATQRLE